MMKRKLWWWSLVILIVVSAMIPRAREHFKEKGEHRVAVVINSCKKFYTKSVPKLLSSLKTAGFPNKHVFMVVGEDANERNEWYGNGSYQVNALYRAWGNIDNNGMILLAKDNKLFTDYEWIFYMHDTCNVTPKFGTNIHACLDAYQDSPHVKAVKLCNTGMSMSMGFYKREVFSHPRIISEIGETINFDLSRNALLQVKHKVEDIVFDMIKKLYGASSVTALENSCHHEVGKTDTTYGGSERHIEEYPMPGVTKYKANLNVIAKIDI